MIGLSSVNFGDGNFTEHLGGVLAEMLEVPKRCLGCCFAPTPPVDKKFVRFCLV